MGERSSHGPAGEGHKGILPVAKQAGSGMLVEQCILVKGRYGG
jgi:hypothetical protein